MKTVSVPALLASLSILLLPHAFGQGALTPPPGPPAPTMKSLQQIWDKIDGLEARTAVLEMQNSTLRTQNLQIAQLLGTLASTAGRFSWLLSEPAVALGGTGNSWLAYAPDGRPTMVVFNYLTNDVVFARFNGVQWDLTTVEHIPGGIYSPTMAYGPDGQPAIAYVGLGNLLKIARFDGGNNWTIWDVDATGPSAGPSLAFNADGQPAIAYAAVGTTNSHLKFAEFDGSAWVLTVADTENDTGLLASLAFGPDGRPAIGYGRSGSGEDLWVVKFARRTGGTWATTLVDDGGSATVGYSISLAFGPDGQPAMAYKFTESWTNPNGNSHLVYAHFNGTTWASSIASDGLYGATKVGNTVDLAFGFDGQPSIAFATETSSGFLAVMRYIGQAWSLIKVDGTVGSGDSCSLAFGPDGEPAIAYGVDGGSPLKFARKGIFAPKP